MPRLLGWPKARIRERVARAARARRPRAGATRDRYPAQLSGGQRQRVGLARALAADPPVMLMDEPFGALDPITRDRLQNEFLRLHAEVRKTVIFVTHDIDEAIKMGDRIAILREGGVLAQYDTPDAILARPADDFVARFVGADRGLKRLALRRLDEIELEPLERRRAGRRRARRRTTTLRDALSLMLDARAPTRSSSSTPTGDADRACSRVDAASAACLAELMTLALCSPQRPGDPELRRRGSSSCVRREPRSSAGTGSRATGAARSSPRSLQHIELTLIAVGIGFVIAFAAALVAHRYRAVEPPFGARLALPLHDPEPRALPAARPVHRADGTTVEIALVSYTLLILFRNILDGPARACPTTCSRRPRDGAHAPPDAAARRAAARAAGDHRRPADRHVVDDLASPRSRPS